MPVSPCALSHGLTQGSRGGELARVALPTPGHASGQGLSD